MKKQLVKAAAVAALATHGVVGADVSTATASEGARCRQVLRIAEARTDLERAMLCRASEFPQECESARAILGSAPFAGQGVAQVCSEWPDRRMEETLDKAVAAKPPDALPEEKKHLDHKSMDTVLKAKEEYDELDKTEQESIFHAFLPQLAGLAPTATPPTAPAGIIPKTKAVDDILAPNAVVGNATAQAAAGGNSTPVNTTYAGSVGMVEVPASAGAPVVPAAGETPAPVSTLAPAELPYTSAIGETPAPVSTPAPAELPSTPAAGEVPAPISMPAPAEPPSTPTAGETPAPVSTPAPTEPASTPAPGATLAPVSTPAPAETSSTPAAGVTLAPVSTPAPAETSSAPAPGATLAPVSTPAPAETSSTPAAGATLAPVSTPAPAETSSTPAAGATLAPVPTPAPAETSSTPAAGATLAPVSTPAPAETSSAPAAGATLAPVSTPAPAEHPSTPAPTPVPPSAATPTETSASGDASALAAAQNATNTAAVDQATVLWSVQSPPVASGNGFRMMSQGFAGVLLGSFTAVAVGMVVRFWGHRHVQPGMSAISCTDSIEDGLMTKASEDLTDSLIRDTLE